MKKEIPKSKGGKRPGAGRPATGNDPARTIRLSDDFLAKVDEWASQQDDEPARSEAIRRLVEIGLAADQRSVVRLHEAKTHAELAAELAAEIGLKAKGK